VTYDYICESCDTEFSTEQKISDEPLKQCFCCGKRALRRLISGSGVFALKGRGWFKSGGY
jgi:putative FmdB family regulatory protein